MTELEMSSMWQLLCGFAIGVVLAAWWARMPAAVIGHTDNQQLGPQPGETWHWSGTKGDPWTGKKWTVKILDAKSGWVRYSMGNGWSAFQDQRMEAASFINIYSRSPND